MMKLKIHQNHQKTKQHKTRAGTQTREVQLENTRKQFKVRKFSQTTMHLYFLLKRIFNITRWST